MVDKDIKQKILKLLNVTAANGSSEAEVAFAMSAASKLMLAHGISRSELEQSQAVAGRSENTEFDNDWQKVLAQTAGNLFGCMTQRDRANYRRTFKYACSVRVYHRADDLIAEMKRGALSSEVAGGTALVVQGYFDKLNDEVDYFLKKTGMRIRVTKAKPRSAGLGTTAGRVAGEAVNLRGALK